MRRTPLIVLALTVFIDTLGFSIIVPVLPYYAEEYGASPAMVGLLFASYSLMQFVFSPVLGSVSDRIGRKPVLLVGLVGAGIGFVIFGMAERLATLFLARVLAGTMAATVPVAMAYAADVTAPERRAQAMGLLTAPLAIALVVGPAIGGTLEHLGHGLPAYVAAALAFGNAIWTAFVLPESLRRDGLPHPWLPINALRVSLHSPPVMLTLTVIFVSLFGFAAMEATFALLVEDAFFPGLDHADLARRVGYLLGYVGIIAIAVQAGLLGRLVKVAGEGRLIPVGLFLMAVGLGLLPLRTRLTWVLLNLAAVAIGSALVRPTVSSVLSQLVPEGVQGGVFSLSQSLVSLAQTAGPAWGGWMYHSWGYAAPYVVGGGIMFAAFVVALVLLALLPAGVRSRRRIDTAV